MDYSMVVFGKPLRKTNCDCERNAEPSLLQAVFLRNDGEMRKTLHRADGWLKSLPAGAAPAELIRQAYLRTVSREPTRAESERCERYFAEAGDDAEAIEDILWSLVNTDEFITNH
jgi:hypothetical protein